MTMAYWNGMTWNVSPIQVTYLESLSTSFGIETKTNADKEGNSPTEEVANSLVEISLNTTYRVETGTVDVRGMIEAWRLMIGQTGPLIIGGATFGPDKMQLQTVDVSDVRLDANGFMRAVTLGFKFKEYEESDSGVSTSPAGTGARTGAGTGTGARAGTGSALGVGASPGDKANKKPVTMKTNGTTSVITDISTGAKLSIK